MKPNPLALIWSIILIISAGFALAYQTGGLKNLSAIAWILIFAASSAFFHGVYFIAGTQAWGWLFPASLFAALSGTVIVAVTALPDGWIPTLLVSSLAAPFMAAFLLGRARAWALIPAFILSLFAIRPLFQNMPEYAGMELLMIAAVFVFFIAFYLKQPVAWRRIGSAR